MKKNKKSKKHSEIIRDYEGQKSKQLEKLATKMANSKWHSKKETHGHG